MKINILFLRFIIIALFVSVMTSCLATFEASSESKNGHAPTKANFASHLATGDWHSMAVDKDGQVWTWNYGDYGIVGGHGGTKERLQQYLPKQVAGLKDIVAIAAGWSHSIAIDKDGHLWTWGDGKYGKLGHGDIRNQLRPKQVTGLKDLVAISARYGRSMALDKNGYLWTWGYGEYGVLGHGDTNNQLRPKQVVGLKDTVAITAGPEQSMAADKDGHVWIWGRRFRSSKGATTPQRVLGLPPIFLPARK